MTNLKYLRVYQFLIILSFFVSYFFYSYIKSPFYTLAESPSDVFYYLVYAREAADLNFFSWNGLYPSNGFHPLWAIFVAIGFSITKNLANVIILLSLFLFIFFLISFWCFNKIIQIYNDKTVQVISIFIFVLGAEKCFFSYMESGLSVVILLAYIYFIIYKFKFKDNKDISNSIIIGLLSSLIALSRLDMVLIIFPLHGFLILSLLRFKNIKIASILALIPIIVVGSYIFLIYVITGSPVPLSGLVKSFFPYIFKDTEWSQLLMRETKYGIITIVITFFCTILNIILIKSKKVDYTSDKLRKLTYIIYFLLLGIFLHTLYHISFSVTGTIGRWYFAVHLFVSIISITILLFNLKKFFESFLNFNFFSEKKINSLIIIFTLPLVFYITIYSRANIDYKKSQPYISMKFVEILELEKFDKSAKIYDSTDGSFAFFSNMPTFHIKGMAATSDYVFSKKKFLNSNDKHKDLKIFEMNFLKEKKIDYILHGKYVENGSVEEQCIKRLTDYNMLKNNKQSKFSYFLINTEVYLKNFTINNNTFACQY